MTYEYRTSFSGDGQGIQEYGILRIVNGRMFLCEVDLASVMSRFDGHFVEVLFVANPYNPWTEIEPEIAPLVKALQSRGIITVSSCAGHLSDIYHKRKPWIGFFGTLDKSDLDAIIRMGWTVSGDPPALRTLSPQRDATNEDELKSLQESVLELVKALS